MTRLSCCCDWGFDFISSTLVPSVYVSSIGTTNWTPPSGSSDSYDFWSLLQSDLSPKYWSDEGGAPNYTLSTDRSGNYYKCSWGITKFDIGHSEVWNYGGYTNTIAGTPCLIDENGYVYGCIIGGGAVKLNSSGSAIWTYSDSDFLSDVISSPPPGATYGVNKGAQSYIATDESGNVYFLANYSSTGVSTDAVIYLVKVNGSTGAYIDSVLINDTTPGAYVTGPVRCSDGSIAVYLQQPSDTYDDILNFATDLTQNWSVDFSSSRSFQQANPSNYFSYPICATHDGGLIVVGKNSANPNQTYSIKRFEISDQSITWTYTFPSSQLQARQVAVDKDNNVYFAYAGTGTYNPVDWVYELGAAAGGVSISGLDSFSGICQFNGIAVTPGTAPYSKL